MSAVRGRDPETALAAGANAVLLHQPLYPLLAHAKALSPQLSPDPRPAVGSAIRRIHGADMHQQSLITQMATRNHTPPAHPVFMVTAHAPPQNSTLHTDRPHPPVTLNKGVLHFWPFAKYAVAFPRMSRSILTRDNSARKRLISICSTLTALLLAGPFSRPSRFALTQLYKVCSTTPRLRAVAAMLWPDSTIRTASCLNSSVYCARVAFVISVSLALLNHSARDTFCAGKVKHKDGVCWFFTGYHDENGVHHGSIDEKGRAHVHGKSAPRLVLYYRDKRSKPYSVKYNPLWAGHLAPVFCKFVGCIKPSHLFWAPPDDERRKQKRDRQIKSKRIKRKFRKYASKLTPK